MTSLIALIALSQAKPKPFADEVNALLAKPTPAPGKILFVGSSSFRMWKDLDSAFPNHAIVNRSFGGSSLLDQIEYRSSLISSYRAKQIVMYCGENDLAANERTTGYDVYLRFRTLFRAIRKDQPGVPFVYVSMKPSPSRLKLLPKMKDGNRRIRQYLRKYSKTTYVDIVTPMLKPNGEPREELFLDDKLHMNAQGYAIWTKAIEPVLKK